MYLNRPQWLSPKKKKKERKWPRREKNSRNLDFPYQKTEFQLREQKAKKKKTFTKLRILPRRVDTYNEQNAGDASLVYPTSSRKDIKIPWEHSSALMTLGLELHNTSFYFIFFRKKKSNSFLSLLLSFPPVNMRHEKMQRPFCTVESRVWHYVLSLSDLRNGRINDFDFVGESCNIVLWSSVISRDVKA